jgi:phosphatidate cytidylyltransferase
VSGENAAPAAAEPASRNLVMRIIAALILAPIALAVAYAGGWLWAVFVTLTAIGLYAEWLKIVNAQQARVIASGVVALGIAGLCLASGRMDAALGTLSFGLVIVLWLSSTQRLWAATGFVYAGAAELASVLVRRDPDIGFVALILILLVVWATDIGGYFAGRGVGGPKLWPRISPKKTWAGAVGGFAASLAVAAGVAAFDFHQMNLSLALKIGPLLLMGGTLSIVSQLGDLFESWVKRRFGVKDSSHIIPGHGGLLDRLDGYVAAVVVAAIFGILRGGADGVGHGLMIW